MEEVEADVLLLLEEGERLLLPPERRAEREREREVRREDAERAAIHFFVSGAAGRPAPQSRNSASTRAVTSPAMFRDN